MVRPNRRQILLLLFTLLMVVLSFPAVYYIAEKPDIPLSVYSSENSVFIKRIIHPVSGLSVNDKIISIDGIILTGREDIEVIMDTKDIGVQVELKIQSGNEIKKVSIPTIPFYSSDFIIIQILTCLIFILLGCFVLLKTPGNKAAELFHGAMLGASVVMLMTWGKVNPYFDFGGVTRFFFHTAYIFAPVLFVHFSLIFPTDKSARFKYYLLGVYFLGAAILIPTLIAAAKVASDLSTATVTSYINTYNFSRYFMAGSVLASIIIFLLKFIHSEDYVERQKLKWLITGFVIGPLSFTFLWVLPQAFTDYAFIPEEFVYFLMLSVPITFTISIVKYHLLDIDFIIKRSIVYFTLIAGITIIYVGLVLLVTKLVHDIDQTLLSGLSAVFVAFLFNPLKNALVKLVDRKFFRIQYNFKEAVKTFFSEIKEINDINILAEKIISGTSVLIAVQKMVLIDTAVKKSPVILSSMNFLHSEAKVLKEKILPVHDFYRPVAAPDKTDLSGRNYEIDYMLKDININVIVPSLPVEGTVRLILLMGNRKSGAYYINEDIDLLQNILNTASSELSRIKLQQALIRKELETEKLQELNQHKSLFVSSVSHELKTPLTSIKMYAEMLQMSESPDKEKINTYSEYITGESERLTRLIDNVLSFSRIEKGIKTYRKRIADLTLIVNKSVEIMEYQASLKDFTISVNIHCSEMIINADPDAILEIFINLISNSIKYSCDKKIAEICSREDVDNYFLSFKDYGMGISEDDQQQLFQPFFRSQNTLENRIPGTGLGLSIIKHIAEAHNIKIDILSKLNEGTTFLLSIPKYSSERYEKDSAYRR